MTSDTRRRRSWIATGTSGLGLAVLLLSWAPAQIAAADSASEAADFDNGRRQYHRVCAQCHGLNMVNSGVTVYDLRKFPLDQPERFFVAVTNGKSNMPSFRDAMSAAEMGWLWAYVSRRGKSPR